MLRSGKWLDKTLEVVKDLERRVSEAGVNGNLATLLSELRRGVEDIKKGIKYDREALAKELYRYVTSIRKSVGEGKLPEGLDEDLERTVRLVRAYYYDFTGLFNYLVLNYRLLLLGVILSLPNALILGGLIYMLPQIFIVASLFIAGRELRRRSRNFLLISLASIPLPLALNIFLLWSTLGSGVIDVPLAIASLSAVLIVFSTINILRLRDALL